MSQTTPGDLAGGNDPNGHHDHPGSTPNQPLQGGSNFGDSSGPFFSIYSKTAEEEDNKMVERWQKDADGILIFTGLFSAAVAALLAVTVQDLRPSSQDTSAFYLGNIYDILADPNVARASTPSPIKPPPFSRPRYAVWVNSLWFLSLVMSLSCALWATSLHQWARRYIRLTQPARRRPEKRARMRAFFANGVDEMHVPWAVEGLPTLLHLSLFLFFGGLVIFLFNVDQEVFACVVSWIGLFSIVYGLISLLPLIRHDSPYNTPLSIPAWFLYARIRYVAFKVLAEIRRDRYRRYLGLRSHSSGLMYLIWEGEMERLISRWMSGGVEKEAEETAEEQSSEIDGRIFGWTISALGDDDSLEKFFEAIPGFFSSKLVNHLERDFPQTHLETFWGALDGFMDRTSSSNSVTESVKSRRDTIRLDIMSMIPCHYRSTDSYYLSHSSEVPVSIERLQAMARWFTHLSSDVSYSARNAFILRLPRLQERDNRWIKLIRNAYGLGADDTEYNVAAGGDDLLLANLIDISRHVAHSDIHYEGEWVLLRALAQFDIRHTLPELQHGFCTVWNELVQEVIDGGRFNTPIGILRQIRHLYITLHQGTDAAPTAFSASTDDLDLNILFDSEPSPYSLCNFASHHMHHPYSTAHVPVLNSRAASLLTQLTESPDASPHHSTSGGTISQQVKQENRPLSPSHPTTPSEFGGSSQALAVTGPALTVRTTPHLTHASPPGTVAAALQDIPPAATLSRPLEGTTLQDIVAPCAEPTPPVLNESSTSCDADAASASNPLLAASSIVGFSVPAPPLPSRVAPLPNAEFLALLDRAIPSRPTGNAALPPPRARGLVNTGSMCFANTVLQLLIHSPPLWNLFRKLGDLKGQRGTGGPETGGGAIPLPVADATVRFFEEFMSKEQEPPPTQQSLRQAAGEKPREGEEAKKEYNSVGSFEPTYLYDAMKEKRQLKCLLDGQQQDAEEFFRLYLDALDEELLGLLASIGHNSATAVPAVEECEVSQSGQTEVVVRGFPDPVGSPLMRIFGGTFHSTVRAPNQPDAVTVEDWRPLQLDIQHDSVHAIEDALARISHLQPVQLGPSDFSEASQQVLIEVLPPILVLHLKRFLNDVAADGIVKICKHVQFAPELEIPLEIMSPVTGKSAGPVHYKLYGVLYHQGTSAGSGHYTVDVLQPNGDSGSGEVWLHIDDEAVSVVRHEDVFGGDDNERVYDRCVYMLFYRRTAPAWA